MPITDDRTPNLGLKLPYADNMLEDDSQRLRDALTAIDTAVAAKASAASVTALTNTVSTKADLVGGKVPASQLPSSVDDVREFDNYAALPTIGESGTIYVLLTPYTIGGYTASQFRWTGSSYQPIVSSPGSTDAVPEGSSNLYHTPARAEAAVPIATPTTLGKVKIGAGLGIDAEGLLYAAAGGGSVMSIQEIVPASNGVSSITVPGGYTVGTILVGFNGSFLSPNDFTATDGTTIGLVGFTAGTTDTFVVVKLATVVIGSLPVGSVGATQLAPSAVVTSKVDDQAITLQKISASVYGTSGANKLLQLDGTGRLPAIDGSQLNGIVAKQIETLPDPTLNANAMTLPASTHALYFRSPTLNTGAATLVQGTADQLVIPAGATLGFVSGQQGTIAEVIINFGGALEKAVVNLAGGNDLSETGVISTTAISASATAANVFYSTTARTNVPYRVVRTITSTQTTAGQWVSTPSLVQGCGGQAFTSMSSLGYGQKWQDVTVSRALGVPYYNTTSRPKSVFVQASTIGGGGNVYLTVNGITFNSTYGYTGSVPVSIGPIVVPPGGSYSANTVSASLSSWLELG